ncbi:MAG TPA: hypothetical protein VGQ63_13920 [Pseudolabrys sp.]|jgi:hypothetical protein|nr:hypothetical protein [Pseudolabrys sp.]
MTTFTKIWALKSDTMVEPGTVVEVSLKSGKTKEVTVGYFLGKHGDKFLFAPEKETD